jgi:HK97 family phage prohead protease
MDYHLNIPLEIKLDGEQRNKISGLASTFGNIDQTGDVIERGAFEKCLKRCAQSGRKIVMLDHHKMDSPVGVWERLEETEAGLECNGRLTMSVQRAQELRDLMADGAIDGLSIGFRAVDYYMDRETGVRYLTEIDLREISLVSMPANEQARVTGLKALAPAISTVRDFEHALINDLGFTRNAAKSIAAGGFKASDVRDEPGAMDLADLRDAVASLKQSLGS